MTKEFNVSLAVPWEDISEESDYKIQYAWSRAVDNSMDHSVTNIRYDDIVGACQRIAAKLVRIHRNEGKEQKARIVEDFLNCHVRFSDGCLVKVCPDDLSKFEESHRSRIFYLD